MGALLLAGGDQVIRMRLKETRALVMVKFFTGSGGAGEEGGQTTTNKGQVHREWPNKDT